MTNQYPIASLNQRHFAESYDGPVFIWDIDKTYLTTHFSTIGGLLKIPFELAIDKHAVTGTPQILRDLRRGPDPSQVLCQPLYFISASPPQLRSIIQRKMLLDGVEYDGLIFKDWIGCVTTGNFRRLFDHLSFKINALLGERLRRPLSNEYLFGDNFEQDPTAYGLYGKLINKRPTHQIAEQWLEEAGIKGADRREILQQYSKLNPSGGRVLGVYVHQAKSNKVEKDVNYGHQQPMSFYQSAGELRTYLQQDRCL